MDSQSSLGMGSHDNVQTPSPTPPVHTTLQGNLLPGHVLFANTQGQRAGSMPPWWDRIQPNPNQIPFKPRLLNSCETHTSFPTAFLRIRVTAQLSLVPPSGAQPCTRAVCTPAGLQSCVLSYTIIAHVLSSHRAPHRLQHLHCPQARSVLVEILPGASSLPGLSCCVLSLAAFHSEMLHYQLKWV